MSAQAIFFVWTMAMLAVGGFFGAVLAASKDRADAEERGYKRALDSIVHRVSRLGYAHHWGDEARLVNLELLVKRERDKHNH